MLLRLRVRFGPNPEDQFQLRFIKASQNSIQGSMRLWVTVLGDSVSDLQRTATHEFSIGRTFNSRFKVRNRQWQRSRACRPRPSFQCSPSQTPLLPAL